MLYTSVKFLLFLLGVFILYFVTPRKGRWIVLLAGSLYFWFGLGLRALGFVSFSTLTVYVGAIIVARIRHKIDFCKENNEEERKIKKLTRWRKAVSSFVILLNLGILCYFKYSAFVLENLQGLFSLFSFELSEATRNIIVPLGLSFYTFQLLGYMFDVSGGKAEPEKNPAKFFLFSLFFPQTLQGPIGRYNHLAPQLFEGHSFDKDRVYDGLILIMYGFFKKMVIADRAAIFANTVFSGWDQYSGIATFLGLLIYAIQLYADFSGGIDISRGVAQVVGIDMAKNFNQPFFAKSVQEYWNRWHMSLGAWMKDYVFYSVPSVKFIVKTSPKTKKVFGTKVGKNIPSALMTIVCFLLIGIWHDASWNYVVFGLCNGLIIGINSVLKPYYKSWFNAFRIDPDSDCWNLFRIIRTFLICMVLRVSHSGGLHKSIHMVTSLFHKYGFYHLFDDTFTTGFGLNRTDFRILFMGCAVVFLVSLMTEKGVDVRTWIRKQGFVVKLIVPLFLVFATMMFAVLDTSLIGGFLYAQF